MEINRDHSVLEVLDKRFSGFVPGICALEQLYAGAIWAEGPLYFSDCDFLLFSDIPNNRILRWVENLGVTIFRYPSNFTNGNFRDRQGRLISCQHGGRRVVRTEPDGSITTIADSYDGKKLNSPNDVVVQSNGMIWFTDPHYGLRDLGPEAREQPENYVFRVDPSSNEIEVVANGFEMPNGLAFSPDESVLYVADSGNPPTHIRAFDVADGRRLTNGRVFAEVSPGVPDGFRVDVDGRVFTSAGDGIHVLNPGGRLIGKILCPESPSNCAFGGEHGTILYITARTSVYWIELATSGA